MPRRLALLALILPPLLVLGAGACGGEGPESVPSPTATGELTEAPAETPQPAAAAPAVATVPPATATATPSATPDTTGRITLNAVGDLMLARDIITLMEENGSVYPFAEVRHLMEDADITIANMEGALTGRGEALNKFYTFRTPPEHAAGLAEAGIDIVSLGNNHAMDFSVIGLEDTFEALDAAGLLYSGAGLNAEAAREAAVLERNGLKLAFLSYAGARTEALPAGETSPGVALAGEAAIREDVAAAANEADIVIVSLHVGLEYTDEPTAEQRALSRAAIDAGAGLVLGHHAHVLQGWERYGPGVIVYGLGNFVFDLDYDDLETLGPAPFLTAVLRFELTGEGVQSVEARPVFIDPAQNRPVPAVGERLREIEERIGRLNAGLR